MPVVKVMYRNRFSEFFAKFEVICIFFCDFIPQNARAPNPLQIAELYEAFKMNYNEYSKYDRSRQGKSSCDDPPYARRGRIFINKISKVLHKVLQNSSITPSVPQGYTYIKITYEMFQSI